MITCTQDHDTLLRILGRHDIPEQVEQEYHIRASMYHMEANGPLGLAMLIDLVRALGYMPPKVAHRDVEVDWRDYPQDGRTKIESLFFGSWMPGEFRGFSSDGLLMLKMEHDDTWKEVRRDLVKLKSVESLAQVEAANEPVDVRGELVNLEEEAIELGRKAHEAARLLERTRKTADRNAERNGGSVDPILADQIAELTQQSEEATAQANAAKARAANPKPIKLSSPAPRGPKAKGTEADTEVAADDGDQEVSEVEYKEYVPKGPTTIEDLVGLEVETPLFVTPANPNDDALEAVFLGITEDNLVQVRVDGEEVPRAVAPAEIILVT